MLRAAVCSEAYDTKFPVPVSFLLGQGLTMVWLIVDILSLGVFLISPGVSLFWIGFLVYDKRIPR